MNELKTLSWKPYWVYCTVSNPTEARIMKFRDLKEGWNYGEGMPFSDSAIEEAAQVHRQITFSGFAQTDAFPGPNGEIQITVYDQCDYFEFERDQNGHWTIIHERNGLEAEPIECLGLDQVIALARTMKSTICDASTFYRRLITGTPQSNVSTVWHSERLPRMVAYPSLIETVR